MIDESRLQKVTLQMLATDAAQGTFVMFLADEASGRAVPIGIGAAEATSILLAMEGEKFPRPLSHDLLQQILRVLDATLERIVITEIKENAFCATLCIRSRQNELMEVDARPSDSVALGLRMGTPLYMSELIFEEAAIELPSGESTRFDKFVESEMKLSEFWHRKQDE
jgi:bifunctional DNase/RNase